MKISHRTSQSLGRAAAGFLSLATLLTASTVAHGGYSGRTVSTGRTWNLGSIDPGRAVNVPAADDLGAIVGIGIAGSNDHVYAWYADGTVSSGTSRNFEYYQGKRSFTLPEDVAARDIVAMAIAGSDDHVYTWYADGTVSSGWSRDLDAYRAPRPYALPPGREASDLVGIAIAGSNDHVYAWYSDGTVSEGTTEDLDRHRAPYSYALPGNKKIGHIIDVAIAGSNDRVYTWFHDVEAGSGHGSIVDEVDAQSMDVLRRYRLPGMSVSVSKNGRVVLEKAYGFRNFTTGSRMQTTSRVGIGSVSKVITALSVMHLDQESGGFSVDDSLYGSGGALWHPSYLDAQDQGVSRHQPIVAKAIAPSDHVYTWYHDGTVSSGTSRDPDRYTSRRTYSLPPGKTPEDIRAIAIAPNGWVWTWYDDATYSAGRSWDLDRLRAPDEDDKVSLPRGYAGRPNVAYKMSHILGMAIAPDGDVYVWYDDGTQSAGSVSDLDLCFAPRSYSTTYHTRYSIRSIGIAKSSSQVYTWYNDGTATRGWSRDLDAYEAPYDYGVPAGAYDPDKDWYAWYEAMQVDHLLSHSAGFIGGGDVPGAEAMFSRDEDDLDYWHVHQYVLGTRKLAYEAGTDGGSAFYSNHGMGLVGHIVATRSGRSYRDYVRRNIIDPLDLKIRASSAGVGSQDAYRHTFVGGVPEAYDDDPSNDLGLAAGGWKSSAGDLVRLMLATDQKPNHPDILSVPTLQRMETRPYPSVSTYAHGWDKTNGGKLAHGGLLGGGTAYIAKYPRDYFGSGSKQITVAVCTNLGISKSSGGTSALRRLANYIAATTSEASISGSYDLH